MPQTLEIIPPTCTPTSSLATGVARVSLVGLRTTNNVVQARSESNNGLSSGDAFLGDTKYWVRPYGTWTDQEDVDGVAGFDATTWGLVMGTDGVIGNSRLGVALGYGNSNVKSNPATGPVGADIALYQLIGYGSHLLAPSLEANFQVGVGLNDNEGRRIDTGTVADSEYTSWTGSLGAGIGQTFALGAATTLTPSLRADYVRLWQDAYGETGTGTLLNVASQDTEQLIAALQGRLDQRHGAVLLTARAGVGYDVIRENAVVTGVIAGSPSSTFASSGITPERWIGSTGLSATYRVGVADVSARYDNEFREDYMNQTISAHVRWPFGAMADSAPAPVAGSLPKATDADADGVVDADDACPGTPAGIVVTANGCARLADLTLQGVKFAAGSATLTASSSQTLDAVAASLKINDEARVEVGGHTDNSGNDARNQELSQARADAVVAYLVGKGIDADRLVAKGYGSTQPVATNTSADGRARNRRVELKLLK